MGRSTLRTLALLAAFALFAMACGDDDDVTDADDGTTVDDAAGSEDEAPDAATGEPIRVGYLNSEEGANVFPDMHEGSDAAIAYINDHGGVNGRPIELISCTTNGTPEQSQACASELVEDEVPFVHGGIDFGVAAAIPVFDSAGLIYVPTLPTVPEEFASPNVFTFFGGSAGQFAGQVAFMLDQGYEDVGILVIGGPQGQAAADILRTPLEDAGVAVNVVSADATTADFTPSVTALMGEESDVLTVLFNGPPCGLIMQAMGSLAVDVPVLYPSGCSDGDYVEAGGAGATDAIFSIESVWPHTNQDDEEVQLYLDAMEQYADKSLDELTTYNQVAFITAYNLAEAMRRIDGEITSDALQDALSNAEHPSLMAPPYQCGEGALPGMTSICNATIDFIQWTGSEWAQYETS